ncbi:hypothetical protein EDC96DRAFT_582299 [Choanephora cucurbitarum]|nr:hypothetical protein EDC96DRAFT_582299 [Choanephora cucurbitarum]
MHIPPPLIGPETIKIPTLPQVDDRRSDNGSNNDILSLTDEDIISLCHSIVNEDSRANDQDINMNDNSDGNEEIKPDITNQEDEAKDDDSLQTVASNLTISSARISEVSASSLTPQIPASISLEVHRLPSMEVIGVSSDSRSDTSDESVLPPSSSSSASEKSDTASPMLLSSASEVNNQDPSDTVDERIDISDFVRDTEIQEVSSTSDSDQDVQDMSDEQANRSSCLYSQPIINIVGSNNQVVLVQGHDQAVTLMSTNNQVEVNMTSTTSVSLNEPSSSHEDIDSHPSPLPASLPTSDVQVEVIDVTSSPAASSATLPTITHTSPLLLTAPSTILPSDVSPPPPQPPSSKPFAEHEVVQRRTSGQEGDNVMATNEGGLSNQVNLDFANTEEIPALLRNWNANKKRKFKPKPCSNSPAKRQRRSGPDSF